eukprot:CAMPEP_0115033952 /NCGR_PEP_ID=MMETSP0216-20121206/40287_1 /TAXON_ID=223996 /ORGANISM="Protocruzia adherens, Strain Boccale" /LENGTH=692 /DNA_ID=CAMNT_0002412595 /DNA_START=459 /DNA_END=2538 /DNA_ORIENTATION=+
MSVSLSTGHKSESFKKTFIRVSSNDVGLSIRVPIHPWTTTQELKHKIQEASHLPVKLQRDLQDGKPHVVLGLKPSVEGMESFIELYGKPLSNSDSKKLIEDVKAGFAQGFAPELTLDGTGGTYFLKDIQQKFRGVFKPLDEEAFAPNNPRNYIGKFGQTGMRNGVLSGESALREVGAFLLDHEGFHNVPRTLFVEAFHHNFYNVNEDREAVNEEYSDFLSKLIPGKICKKMSNSQLMMKYGSLQEFMVHDDLAENYAPSIFSVVEVQKIAILDIRLLNMDRNSVNILLKKRVSRDGKKKFKLIPIDHGLCMPDVFEITIYDLQWMEWAQTREPICKKGLEHIEKLDPRADVEKLKKNLYLRDRCLRNFRVAGLLLKKGAKAGLTLHQIGTLLYRPDYDDTPSEVEVVVEKAVNLAKILLKSIPRDIWNRKIHSKSTKTSPEKKQGKVVAQEPNKKTGEELTTELINRFDEITLKSSQSMDTSKVGKEASPDPAPKKKGRLRSYSNNFEELEYRRHEMRSDAMPEIVDEEPATLFPRKNGSRYNSNHSSMAESNKDSFATAEESHHHSHRHSTESLDLVEDNDFHRESAESSKKINPPLKRCLSLPQLVKDESVDRHSVRTSSGFEKPGAPTKNEATVKKFEAKLRARTGYDEHNSALDDQLFHYIECFIDQLIDRKLASTKKANRKRFMSEL